MSLIISLVLGLQDCLFPTTRTNLRAVLLFRLFLWTISGGPTTERIESVLLMMAMASVDEGEAFASQVLNPIVRPRDQHAVLLPLVRSGRHIHHEPRLRRDTVLCQHDRHCWQVYHVQVASGPRACFGDFPFLTGPST